MNVFINGACGEFPNNSSLINLDILDMHPESVVIELNQNRADTVLVNTAVAVAGDPSNQ